MKFLSDILAKAGLTVDGVVTLNNTATGQTPDANDNSTKLATTAWVRGFVTPYSLPIASSVTLGGVKIGSGLAIDGTGIVSVTTSGVGAIRALQQITATAGQTVFTVSGGYTPGLIDVFLNGVLLTPTAITSTNGTTFTLTDGAIVNDLLDIFVYNPIYNGFISTTDQVPEGSTNLYYTNARARAAISLTTTGTSGSATYNSSTGVLNIPSYIGGVVSIFGRTGTVVAVSGDYTTTLVTEGTNLYYTDARARAAISVTGSGSYDSATGVITVTGGVTSVNTLTGAVILTTTNIAEGTNLYYTDARVLSYLTANSYATQTYVGTQIANLVASAPATLDTLNELAAALGNDPSFATTVATSIGTKVPQTRTITINGTTLDLSADRSFTIASGVTSFNTRTGAITPTSGDYTTALVTESGNLYYTDARARAAISLTTTGTSGAASYNNTTGVLNIPQYQGGVTSFNTRTGAITLTSSDVTTALTYTPVTNARTLTINGDAYDLTADRTWTIGVTPSARTIQTYTATAAQTTFTVTGGYIVGLVDVFINGVRLTSADFTASNGTTVVLTTGTGVNNIVDVIKYTSAFTATNALRQITNFTATAGQTSFTVSYTPGLIDVFYNGSKLVASEYTASNGTTVVLANAAVLNDLLEIISYSYTVGAYSGLSTTRTLTINGTSYDLSADRTWTITNASLGAQPQLNGTGLVRMSGTTVSYDNATYATESYVTTAVANLVDAAPATLDTLNELAAALGDDPNFATTIATSIGTKQPQLNGTGFVKISGTTISYDNSTYLTTASASSTYVPYTGATANVALGSYNLSLTSLAVNSIGANNNGLDDIGALGGNTFRNVYANSFVRTSGTSSQFLKADGTVDSSTYLTTASASSTYLPLAGGTLTGGLGGTTASFSSTITSSSSINAGDSVTLLGELYWGGTSSGQKTRAYTTGSSGSATLNYSFWTGSAWFIRATLDSNGAATFISSVTAGTDIRTDGGTVQVGAGSNNYYTRLATVYNYPYVDSFLDSMAGASYDGRLTFRIQRNGGTVSPMMTILPTGLIGMGTINPASGRKLTVAGGAQFTYADNAGASFNIVPGATGQDGADFNLSYYTGTDYGPLTFTLAGLERLRITSEGYLGTTVTSNTVSSGDLLGVLSFVSKDSSTYSSGGITNIRSYATSTYNTGNVAGDLRFYVSNGLQNTTASYLFGTEAMRINSDGVVRVLNLTSNGLTGTDSSGNLRTVISEYTEIATGSITYSNNSGSPWGINNSFPATIRNYDDDGMAGSAGVATSLNLGRGVTFDLGSAKAVRRIVERGYPTKNLNVIIAQYSTDNSNWTDIYVYNHIYGNTQKIMEFNPTGAISARYWRWFIHSWTEREVTNYYTYENIIYT